MELIEASLFKTLKVIKVSKIASTLLCLKSLIHFVSNAISYSTQTTPIAANVCWLPQYWNRVQDKPGKHSGSATQWIRNPYAGAALKPGVKVQHSSDALCRRAIVRAHWLTS